MIGFCLGLIILALPVNKEAVADVLSGKDYSRIALIACIFILYNILMIIYTLFFVGKFGGTLGKLLFGMKIVDRDSGEAIGIKRAFLRTYLGYTFSSQFFGLGYWRIVKHPEKLAWHDELFNTKVVITRGPLLGIIVSIVFPVLSAIVIYNVIASVLLPSIPLR